MTLSFGGIAGEMILLPDNRAEREFIELCERQVASGGCIHFDVLDSEDKLLMAYHTRNKLPQARKV